MGIPVRAPFFITSSLLLSFSAVEGSTDVLKAGVAKVFVMLGSCVREGTSKDVIGSWEGANVGLLLVLCKVVIVSVGEGRKLGDDSKDV